MSSGRATRDQRQAKVAALRARAARSEARRRQAIVGGIVLAVVLIVVVVFVMVQNARRDVTVTAPANLGTDNSIFVGDPDAPVTLAVYEDFLCPVCNQFEKVNAEQIDAWVKAGTVRVAYRPVAILDDRSTTDYSTRALNAVAAVVDSAPSAFAAFHRALFANQPKEGGAGLTDERLIELAVAAGGPEPAVTKAVNDLTYRGWAAQVTEAASKAGLPGTPWIKVNGRAVKSPLPDKLKQAVEAAAAAATPNPTAPDAATAGPVRR